MTESELKRALVETLPAVDQHDEVVEHVGPDRVRLRLPVRREQLSADVSPVFRRTKAEMATSKGAFLWLSSAPIPRRARSSSIHSDGARSTSSRAPSPSHS